MNKKVREVKFEKGSEIDAAFEEAKRDLPKYMERALFIAETRKISYDAHIEQGFTPEQALYLCKDI